MIDTWKVHQRFLSHWSDYQNKDLLKVCVAILKLMKIKVQGNGLNQIKSNWGKICQFLINWCGTKQV